MGRPSTASATEESLDKTGERPVRPLYAQLTAETKLQAPAPGVKAKTNGGRWSLNAGSLMTTCVSGLNMQRDAYGAYAAPIRLVVDLASAKFAKPVMPALGEHYWDRIVGNWSGGEIGDVISADLSIYEARTPIEGNVLAEAVRAKALLDQGHPWQASIGAVPEDGIDGYEEVPEGESVTVNGATFTNDDPEAPLYVMRKAVITEASICTFGADQNTGPMSASARRRGQLAASATTAHTTSKDSSAMKYNLRAMLTLFAAHAALVAEHVAAAQELPEDKQPTQEALQASIEKAIDKAELTAAKAALAAKDAELAALKAGKPPGVAVTRVGKTEAATPPSFTGGAEGEGEADAPATVHAAMAILNREDPKLRGFRLHAAALKKWPALKATLPDAGVPRR